MNTLIASAFALGLATSVHCISMCGPMVVTYAVSCGEGAGWRERLAPNLAYQGAKIASYTVVGLLLGAIGSFFDVDGVRPYVMVAAGLFMIVLGLGMTGRVPWALKLTPRPPQALVRALSRLRRRSAAGAEGGNSLAVPVSFGLLTGLMPCAPLQAAQLVAATSGSALSGAVTMLAFGIGTAPVMLAFGTASSLVPARWRQRLNLVLVGVVIISGLVFLNRAALITGFPVNSQTLMSALSGPRQSEVTAVFDEGADGVAEVPLVIQSVQYFPASVVVPAGRPVRLVVDRREANTCSDELVIPNLGVSVALAPNGVTEVMLPASEPGVYPMTCGMAMMSGQIVVVAPNETGS
ncbi:MAG: sulfite exporter TauE/SafE family protein [Coriobacteriia bacterium]|nr:sulfite exporter TauE/SafE family protein [Coriobacteriia bacterium]